MLVRFMAKPVIGNTIQDCDDDRSNEMDEIIKVAITGALTLALVVWAIWPDIKDNGES